MSSSRTRRPGFTAALALVSTAALTFFAVAAPALFSTTARAAGADAASTAGGASATYNVDAAHSSAAFKVRHLVSKVSGNFKDFSGTITGDLKNPAGASVSFTIKAASIDTGNGNRDKHLNSPDFFDTAKFPEITFKSSKITAKGGDKYDVLGTFTMHGVSKEIVVPVTFGGVAKDPWGNERAGFAAELTLNRKDYGIVWNKVLDAGGTLLGEDVAVTIEIEAVKQGADKK
jgi:polyisoprenoid-binding protein YceI